jgi:hypothetical protein
LRGCSVSAIVCHGRIGIKPVLPEVLPMKMMGIYLLLSVLAVALASWSGCDSGSDDGTDTVTQTDDGGAGGGEIDEGNDAGDLAYPAGPYGKAVGSIVENLTFYDPAAGAEVSLSSLYQHPDKKVLLLTSGAGWCAACKEEAVEMKGQYSEYGEQGLEIWSTLFQDYNGSAPTEAFWQQWKAQLSPNYPLLLDADFVLEPYFNPESAPMNMIIVLETMEITLLETGFDPAVVEAELKKHLE